MKKIGLIISIVAVSSIVQLVGSLPWWGFLIPVLIMGVFLGRKEWIKSGFMLGFFAGFLNWGGMICYYHYSSSGEVLGKVSSLFSLPAELLMLSSALVGGLLTGFAFYTGSTMLKAKGESSFDL